MTALMFLRYNITCKVVNLNSLQVIFLLEKMIRMGELYDFYGQLLTERQQEFMNLYYLEDLSLGEIAERYAISRQAVYDNLRRAGNLLEEYEAKLGLLARTQAMKQTLQDVKSLIENLDCNIDHRKVILDKIELFLDN